TRVLRRPRAVQCDGADAIDLDFGACVFLAVGNRSAATVAGPDSEPGRAARDIRRVAFPPEYDLSGRGHRVAQPPVPAGDLDAALRRAVAHLLRRRVDRGADHGDDGIAAR